SPGRAVGKDQLFVWGDEVVQDITVGVFDDGTHGYVEIQYFTVFTVLQVSATWFAVRGFAVGLVVKVQQCGDVGVSNDDDVATVPAVSAVGTAEGLEFFSTHGGLPVSTVACGGMHGHMINEL